jgi:Na+(H+)/acetate symporter ActP
MPSWVGPVTVALIVGGVVAAGGMRSITFVQAFHYWLKLTAMGVPLVLLLIAAGGMEQQLDPAVLFPEAAGPSGQDAYRSASLMLALLLGTMGLPHVLVRFYTSPNGSAARNTTVFVIVMIAAMYVLSSTMGLLARVVAPDLANPNSADSVVLLLPSRLIPGPLGDMVTALLIAGAFAAFLSTSSGLVVSVAGVVSQELLGGSVRGFRVAALVSALVPLGVSFFTVPQGLTSSVGLVFLVAASSIAPVLLLGVWWPGLTAAGAISGMVVGAVGCVVAVTVDGLGLARDSVIAAAVDQPAAWTVLLAVLTTAVVSRATRTTIPVGADARVMRLHRPEG